MKLRQLRLSATPLLHHPPNLLTVLFSTVVLAKATLLNIPASAEPTTPTQGNLMPSQLLAAHLSTPKVRPTIDLGRSDPKLAQARLIRQPLAAEVGQHHRYHYWTT